MADRFDLRCPIDQRFLGSVPFKPLWTGAVPKVPIDEITLEIEDADLYPEDEPANIYVPCETCRKSKRAHWMRFEEIPENASIQIIVPVIVNDSEAA